MISRVRKKIFRFLQQNSRSQIRKGGKRDFIFIHINKTAGTSVSKTIGLHSKQHLTVKQIIDIVGQDAFANCYKFCFVRNPWTRVVSHYNYRVKTNQTMMVDKQINFKDWVRVTYGHPKDPFYYDIPQMFQPQVEWIKDYNGKIACDFIGRFESLVDDFEKIKSAIGISCELPHLNRTYKINLRDYFDEGTIEIIAEWFNEDIRIFDYSFDWNL